MELSVQTNWFNIQTKLTSSARSENTINVRLRLLLLPLLLDDNNNMHGMGDGLTINKAQFQFAITTQCNPVCFCLNHKAKTVLIMLYIDSNVHISSSELKFESCECMPWSPLPCEHPTHQSANGNGQPTFSTVGYCVCVLFS